VHAEAGHDLPRGAQEPCPVRPGVGVKNHPLTTCHLVRRAVGQAGPAPRCRPPPRSAPPSVRPVPVAGGPLGKSAARAAGPAR
jgi:hypothetical protein